MSIVETNDKIPLTSSPMANTLAYANRIHCHEATDLECVTVKSTLLSINESTKCPKNVTNVP